MALDNYEAICSNILEDPYGQKMRDLLYQERLTKSHTKNSALLNAELIYRAAYKLAKRSAYPRAYELADVADDLNRKSSAPSEKFSSKALQLMGSTLYYETLEHALAATPQDIHPERAPKILAYTAYGMFTVLLGKYPQDKGLQLSIARVASLCAKYDIEEDSRKSGDSAYLQAAVGHWNDYMLHVVDSSAARENQDWFSGRIKNLLVRGPKRIQSK